MLPDYPAFKCELAKFLGKFLRARFTHHLGFAAAFPRHRVFEGNATHLTRADGTSESAGFEQLEAARTIPFASVGGMTLGDVLEQLEEIAMEMADKHKEFFFRRIDETVANAGGTIDGSGEPLSPDALLGALDRMDLEFDDHGRIRGLMIVTHPSGLESVLAAHRLMETNPVIRRRHQLLLERKREEYRAREASRRLVG